MYVIMRMTILKTSAKGRLSGVHEMGSIFREGKERNGANQYNRNDPRTAGRCSPLALVVKTLLQGHHNINNNIESNAWWHGMSKMVSEDILLLSTLKESFQ